MATVSIMWHPQVWVSRADDPTRTPFVVPFPETQAMLGLRHLYASVEVDDTVIDRAADENVYALAIAAECRGVSKDLGHFVAGRPIPGWVGDSEDYPAEIATAVALAFSLVAREEVGLDA